MSPAKPQPHGPPCLPHPRPRQPSRPRPGISSTRSSERPKNCGRSPLHTWGPILESTDPMSSHTRTLARPDSISRPLQPCPSVGRILTIERLALSPAKPRPCGHSCLPHPRPHQPSRPRPGIWSTRSSARPEDCGRPPLHTWGPILESPHPMSPEHLDSCPPRSNLSAPQALSISGPHLDDRKAGLVASETSPLRAFLPPSPSTAPTLTPASWHPEHSVLREARGLRTISASNLGADSRKLAPDVPRTPRLLPAPIQSLGPSSLVHQWASSRTNETSDASTSERDPCPHRIQAPA